MASAIIFQAGAVPKLTISDFSALGLDKNPRKSELEVEDFETEIGIDYVTLDDCQRFQQNKAQHSRLQSLKSSDFDAWSYTNTNSEVNSEDDFNEVFEQEQTVVATYNIDIPSSPIMHMNKVSMGKICPFYFFLKRNIRLVSL